MRNYYFFIGLEVKHVFHKTQKAYLKAYIYLNCILKTWSFLNNDTRKHWYFICLLLSAQ